MTWMNLLDEQDLEDHESATDPHPVYALVRPETSHADLRSRYDEIGAWMEDYGVDLQVVTPEVFPGMVDLFSCQVRVPVVGEESAYQYELVAVAQTDAPPGGVAMVGATVLRNDDPTDRVQTPPQALTTARAKHRLQLDAAGFESEDHLTVTVRIEIDNNGGMQPVRGLLAAIYLVATPV